MNTFFPATSHRWVGIVAWWAPGGTLAAKYWECLHCRMVQYVFTTADVAASATNTNILNGDRIQVANYPRTIQGIAVVGLQNTPAVGDWSWQLSAGAQLLASGISVVGRTTGNEVVNPDDFTPVGMVVPPNTNLQFQVTDTDAAIHNARIYFLLDRI